MRSLSNTTSNSREYSRRTVLVSASFPTADASLEPVGGIAKRLIDIFLVSCALIVLSPLMAGLALFIKFSSAGPVFYGHNRVGFDGRSFKCWKFRSMIVNGDEVLQRLLSASSAARAEWGASQKLRDDPRVTHIGRVLRKLSLDELPQLFNILIGDMSIVGPRPVVASELRHYGASAVHYLRARPGLTGLWQISGRSDTSYQRRVMFDRMYVTRWNLVWDLWIIAKTVPAVIFSRGSC